MRAPVKGMTWVPGGPFAMGSDPFYPEERPVRRAARQGEAVDTSTTHIGFRCVLRAPGPA